MQFLQLPKSMFDVCVPFSYCCVFCILYVAQFLFWFSYWTCAPAKSKYIYFKIEQTVECVVRYVWHGFSFFRALLFFIIISWMWCGFYAFTHLFNMVSRVHNLVSIENWQKIWPLRNPFKLLYTIYRSNNRSVERWVSIEIFTRFRCNLCARRWAQSSWIDSQFEYSRCTQRYLHAENNAGTFE